MPSMQSMVPLKMKRIEIVQISGRKAAVTHSSRPGMKQVTVQGYNSSGNPVRSAEVGDVYVNRFGDEDGR